MFTRFDSNDIQPTGWLRRQLEIQANGLSGSLDKIWPDVRDSAWFGGNREGWERVPYWLDGFIPLAYLLRDPDMIARADKYIHIIVERQNEDGWLCPCKPEERNGDDLWAYFLIGKVLALYCEFTDDKTVLDSLYRGMKCLKTTLDTRPIVLKEWGKARWFEGIIPIRYLYDRYREEWLLELARKLRDQGTDYPSLTERWKRPVNRWTFETHIVNIGMMFKHETVCSGLLKEKYTGSAEALWKILEKYNGTAAGIFVGDECLGGRDNNRGTELCSVVELMYSLELLYADTGDGRWADRLEMIAFNALPATFTDDMWAHQYDQQSNQIACTKFNGNPIFGTNYEDSNLFGLEPNYGCCTADFSQGWPKLAMNAFLRSHKGIVSPMMLPARLETGIKGAKVVLEQKTSYPFRNNCTYTVSTDRPVRFELKIRIPGWAKSVLLNGSEISRSGFVIIDKEWNGTETFTVELKDEPRLVSRPGGMKTLEYGALVYSLPIQAEYIMHEYTKNGVERKFPYCDYELFPKSDWNYGFAGDTFTVCEQEDDGYPFSSKQPSVSVRAELAKVDWGYADRFDNVSALKPASRKPLSAPETVELIPYGCAKLRVTELPMVCK